MKDIYKQALDMIITDINTKQDTAINTAESLLAFIHSLLNLFLVLVGQDSILLEVELRHIDDSKLKARYLQ